MTWNGARLLPSCLDALAGDLGAGRLAVVVVDNASTDGTLELLASRYPQVQVRRSPVNRGFAGGANIGLAAVRTPYAVLLNNDAQAQPGWLDALLGRLRDDAAAAAAGPKVLLADPPGTINSVGAEVTGDGYGRDRGWREPDRGQYDEPVEVFVASGSALALRMSAVRAVGGLADEFFLYYEDTDLCWRLRLAGWTVWTAPASVVRHEHSASAVADSPLHVFYSERNRLLTLTRNASAGLALRCVLRQPLTTLSLTGRELAGAARGRRRPRLDVVRLRAAAFAAYLRLAPRQLANRRRIAAAAAVPRGRLERRWLVRPGAPVGPPPAT